ncbi:hypothetical protein PBPRA1858 [Photobacterium profundum SS9]|uniref:Uncharacterized protein n=1 Tax=Photobacterium profundum (strain SS9) TaxID=298386 RepID=Q6LR14_PHOPR|nr:hypothetical protein PBPRA1858 [Photobacterium profundum SS9]
MCIHEKKVTAHHSLKVRFPPSQSTVLLVSVDPIKHHVDSRLGFPLHTITGFHRPSLTHYYGFICHLAPTCILSHLLMDASGVCPDVVSGFPSYCTDSLLDIPPSNTVLV